ncbi:YkgJ family cysteine cluster protein [Propionivibrio limicola]|uniref:YkgJ family cysteine cluster protein n=1 Tax=Propionivibrio limicola TaxID=167645 RepID=UPI001291492B|nr:YkgJ family cysteine cluster protein [Propionivibrio limicola]
MTILSDLHADIEARVQAIREHRREWLCSKGCDNCCRQLAQIPQLTAEEWNLLRAGLSALPAQQLQDIGARMVSLAHQSSRPFTCPLLDRATGACPVYAERPIACRTYGFYVQRGSGLYCHDIEASVAAGALTDVVWGNQDAIDHRLASLGETRALTAWFSEWITESFAA